VFNINDKKSGEPFTDDEFALLKIIANQAAITLENALLMTQLRSKAAELEEINKKLIESDASKTEFLTRVSHELRTPLNSIKGAIYYLGQNRHVGREKMQEFFDIIAHETDNLGRSVENLLNFLRLEDETRIMKKSVIDIPSLLNNEVLNSGLLETFLMRRNLQVTIAIQKDISHIVGDKVRVIQLFINMIKGLGSYLEPGDRIEMNVYERDFVYITLLLPRQLPESLMSDNPHALQVFQEEHSEDKARLHLARKILDIHRWRLDYSVSENGSTVSLAIPKGIKQKIEAIADATMEMFVELISALMNLKVCSIMLTDEFIDELFIKCAKGLDHAIIRQTRIKLGDSISGWVAFEGKPLLIEDIESDPRFHRKYIPHYNTRSLLSLPLKVDGKVIGVINLNNKKSQRAFTMQDLYIAEAFNERISYFIGKLYSGQFSGEELNEFITSFDSLLDAGRKYHKKDGFLPDLIGIIMNKLGAGEEDVRRALYVSVIYDLGVVLIDEITEGKRDLSPSEICSLKAHPHTTVGLINHFEFSEDVKKAIIHHHERYDGTGYPDSLKGEEIPFVARVLSVADAFDAMTRNNRHKKPLSKEDALREIVRGSGTAYDPTVVNALQSALGEIACPPARASM
ncbi:MAG: GAF domain-containing protein, partial [Nitrospiraceae bacterium]|nr:GAF domain-containing protein [Nitrospiraceae bacterium]